ncbi:MAG: Na+/H+ antiporter NhaC family protein, partial [Candidatus Poribacteria bacterium]|nr:Na+/H+ antiporter NhaC family protein [Candidatus Poribacteria bacterium]
ICILAAWRVSSLEPSSGLVWYSIIPPLLAVTLAISTSRLILSLGLAVATGTILASVRNHPASIGMWMGSLSNETVSVVTTVIDSFNLQVIAFIVLILSMISVVIASGGLQGIINWLARFAKGPRSTQFVTVLMGLAIFIDDYANSMIVGSAMRPATDGQRISREKLAFLVDATSAPVAGLAVVSTWIGYEVGLFGDVANSLGIQKDGYSMFFDALNFRFYCIMMIVFMLVNVISGRDYGAMRKAEDRARKTGAVIAADASPMASKVFSVLRPVPSAVILARSAIIPIATLFGLMLGGFWIDGGGSGFILSMSAWRDALSNADNIKILAIASGSGFLVSIACAKLFSKTRFSEIGQAVFSGIKGSLLPTVILILAWGLKGVCDRLSTGDFLGATMSGVVSPVWFPALLFIVTSLTSFATGTSWGTMAILIPTAIPIAFSLDGGVYGLTTMICLGAVLDGSIFGDHCSPISDTTIISSISSSCDPIHHVRTQLPYSLTVAGLALICGYLPAAVGMPSFVGIGLSAALIVLLFYGISRLSPIQREIQTEDRLMSQ